MVTSKANANDIEWNSGENPISIDGVGVFAMYFSQAKKLILSQLSENVEISLEPFNFELITVAPVSLLEKKCVHFAPIGLVNMLNNGGAIQSLAFDEEKSSVQVGVRGTGEMRVFASRKPVSCEIDGKEVEFRYEQHMVVIHVPWPTSNMSIVNYKF